MCSRSLFKLTAAAFFGASTDTGIGGGVPVVLWTPCTLLCLVIVSVSSQSVDVSSCHVSRYARIVLFAVLERRRAVVSRFEPFSSNLFMILIRSCLQDF